MRDLKFENWADSVQGSDAWAFSSKREASELAWKARDGEVEKLREALKKAVHEIAYQHAAHSGSVEQDCDCEWCISDRS